MKLLAVLAWHFYFYLDRKITPRGMHANIFFRQNRNTLNKKKDIKNKGQ